MGLALSSSLAYRQSYDPQASSFHRVEILFLPTGTKQSLNHWEGPEGFSRKGKVSCPRWKQLCVSYQSAQPSGLGSVPSQEPLHSWHWEQASPGCSLEPFIEGAWISGFPWWCWLWEREQYYFLLSYESISLCVLYTSFWHLCMNYGKLLCIWLI